VCKNYVRSLFHVDSLIPGSPACSMPPLWRRLLACLQLLELLCKPRPPLLTAVSNKSLAGAEFTKGIVVQVVIQEEERFVC
jgi:hypothetical protein